jgi:NAD(P)-dependent dehydrogenase (short-subunit alcohol dehydrogenase family)
MTPIAPSRLFSLEGRIALVTGGSRGLGLVIAQGLLEQGATVYLSSRKADACQEAAESLRTLGACHAIAADVASDEGIATLASAFAEREDVLDVLVNNAGAVWNEPFDRFSRNGWDRVLDLNLRSPFFMTQAFAPALRRAAHSRPAKVINISSIDALSVNPLETYSYSASKAGLDHLTRRLALRLIEDNIVVNCIAPGQFPSDMNRQARDEGDAIASRIPARRLGNAADIAAAAIYLASSAGDYVVGETLVVDGGARWTRAV